MKMRVIWAALVAANMHKTTDPLQAEIDRLKALVTDAQREIARLQAEQDRRWFVGDTK